MRTLVLLSLALVLVGCKPEVKKPSLTVKSAKVARVEWDQAVVELKVEVKNDNAVPLVADFVRYTGHLAEQKVVEGELQKRITFPAHGVQTVHLPVLLRYAELGDALKSLNGKPKWPWAVKGEVGVQLTEQLKVSLPFERAGTLRAPALPKVKITGAALEEVSLTEATAALTVEVENPNEFAIPAGELDARLKLSGRSLDPVKVQSPRVPKGRTKTLRLKQKLRLQNLGEVAVQVASGKPLEAELLGELRLGERTVPLELKMQLRK